MRAVVPVRTAHGFHLMMCSLTFGLWPPVYVLCAMLNAGRYKAEVPDVQGGRHLLSHRIGRS